MKEENFIYDLVILVADKNMEQSMKGLLARHKSISIKNINAAYICNPQNDSGCRVRPHDLLRYYLSSAKYALVLFDYEGCGDKISDAAKLEYEVEDILTRNGWEKRCAAVVIEPELERWVWTASEEIPVILGQECSYTELLAHLTNAGFLFDKDNKPCRPKEAVEMLLRQARLPRSSSIYNSLASKVSLRRCTDRAFVKFTAIIQRWFPVNDDEGRKKSEM